MKHQRLFTTFTALFMLCACENDETPAPEDPVFSWSGHYIAGTITPSGGSRYSPFLIDIGADSTARFVSTTRVFQGTYSVTGDEFTFHTDDKEKWVFLTLEDEKVKEASYEVRFYEEDGSFEPAPVSYEALAELAAIPEENQLAGRDYTGDQYRFGTEGVFQERVTYRFHASQLSYGSGTEELNDSAFDYQLFNNVAFRHEQGSTKEMGVLLAGKLVVFKESGLFYWGTFERR